jgi:CubicO group peptidase (beta-lactamase class C family)
MRFSRGIVAGWLGFFFLFSARAHEPDAPALTKYFPPSESKGGWRTLLPEMGEPDTEQKSKIRSVAGVDWDKLASAWDLDRSVDGPTGLFVIRRGYIVGEWYKDCHRNKKFNIYSSSKGYTSVAFGMLLADREAGKLPGVKKLTLDTKVCAEEWLPQALPLSDPRKADITLRHLLTMTSGIAGGGPPPQAPFEWGLGHTPESKVAKLTGDPGTVFNYSDANIMHLVLLFKHVTGKDLFPYLEERLFSVIGMERYDWLQIGGGNGKIGPLSQGFSGLHTTPREHARFCYLALQRGDWDGRQIVPASYYDFIATGTKPNPQYGALWWVYPHHPEAPKDMIQTAGFLNNHGYVVPSLDLVFVRLGEGKNHPKNFEQDLVKRVIAAVEK